MPKRDSTSTSTPAAPPTVRGSRDRSRTPPNHAGQQDQEQHFPEDVREKVHRSIGPVDDISCVG